MGSQAGPWLEDLAAFFTWQGFDTTAYGRIPSLLKSSPLSRALEGTLFVNAWDRHSLVGPRNGNDHSLDAWRG